MNDENFKKCVVKVFNLVKKSKFLKIREYFLKIRKIFFFFFLKCKQKKTGSQFKENIGSTRPKSLL